MSDENGTYFAHYNSAQAIVLGEKKTPFITLVFDISHKLLDGKWEECGATFQRNIRICVSDGVWNNETAKRILLDKLDALGFNGDFANPVFSAEFLLSNDGVQLKCEYDGKYNNWDFATSLTQREVQPLDRQIARTLSARYKAAVGTQVMPSTPLVNPTATQPTSPEDSGPDGAAPDVPF